MYNQTLLQKLKSELQWCAGHDGDELAEDRRRALDYYFQRPRGDEVPGRATVVSGDVSASVEASLAAMSEAFSGDRIAEFDPMGPEDAEQAELESDAVTHFVMGRGNGRHQLLAAIKDALLLRNGWVKAWVEEKTTVRTEEYENVTPEAVAELTTRPNVECKILEYTDAGYLRLRCTYIDKLFRCEAVACENVLYPRNYDGVDFEAIQRIPFIAERHVDIRSDLYGMFSREKVDELPKYTDDRNTSAIARNPRRNSALQHGVDKSSEPVEWFEAYAIVNGERLKVCFGHNTILKKRPEALVPYASGSPFIAPHRLTGISLWDKTRQIQDVNTPLQRALLDNVQATSKQKLAYLDGRVNVDDVSDGRVSGGIRVKATVARVTDAVMPFAVPDTSSGIQAAIEHQRRIRTEMAGSALDMQGGELQVSNQVGSMGLDRAFSVAEALSGHMAKNFAMTLVRSTFLIAHAQLREHFGEPINFKVMGRWQTAVPSEWVARESVTVRVGMSPGERSRRQAALDKLLQSQIQLAGLGMEDVLVNVEGFHALLLDWARVSDVPAPENYFIDPRTDEAQAAMQSKQQQAQDAQQQQQELVRQAVELEKLRTAFEKYRVDSQLQHDYWKEQLHSEIEEAKLAGSATVELLKARENPDARDIDANSDTSAD
jgi:hypothetical protein